MIIYLLGPSGVGKSNAVQLLRSDQPQLDIVDLDADFPGRQFDWHAIEPRLAQLHQQPVDGRHVVVDVGAGTQTLSEFSAFLRGAGALVIVVTAPPEQVVLRQPIPNRRVDEFITTEYATRQQLYGLAAVTVDGGRHRAWERGGCPTGGRPRRCGAGQRRYRRRARQLT